MEYPGAAPALQNHSGHLQTPQKDPAERSSNVINCDPFHLNPVQLVACFPTRHLQVFCEFVVWMYFRSSTGDVEIENSQESAPWIVTILRWKQQTVPSRQDEETTVRALNKRACANETTRRDEQTQPAGERSILSPLWSNLSKNCTPWDG